MQFLKLLLGFAPWIAFMFIAHGSLFRLKLGLVVAAALCVVLAALRLSKGVIMWVGLAFFAISLVAVLGFESMWMARNMGVLANGALAVGAWATLAVGKPFTLEYAREHTDPSRWNDPLFLRTNVIITSVWALVFSIGAALAWLNTQHSGQPQWVLEVANYAFMLTAAIFTNAYPAAMKRSALAAAGR